MTIKIYHNPRCSKSRETLALLKEHGVEPCIVEYLKVVPTVQQIQDLIIKLGFSSARQLMRIKETEYKEQNLAQVDNEEALIQAMITYPKLIERPIVINGNKAKIGRPPAQVLEIL